MIKKIYKNVFIGIPLPSKLYSELEDCFNNLREINGNLNISNKNEPHITILFMGDMYMEDLEEISKTFEKKIREIIGTKIIVKGFNYFEKENPRVLFLEVEKTESLVVWFEELKKSLSGFNKNKDREFHPHVTLAKIYGPEDKRRFFVDKEK